MTLDIHLKFPFLFAFLLVSQLGLGQKVYFEATTDGPQVLLNGAFEVTYTLNNAKPSSNITPPSFEGFKQLGGIAQGTSTTIINGKYSSSSYFTFTLQPQKIGNFVIPPAVITVGRKKLKSNSLKIEVIKAKELPKGSSSAGNIFIKAIPSDSIAYPGQQVLVDFVIYTTLDIQGFNAIKDPELNGFYAVDINGFNHRVSSQIIDGVQYTKKTLRKIAIFPQQDGRLDIGSYVMRVSVPKPGAKKRGLFGFRETQTLNISSEPTSINVLKLPPNAPLSFNGAVGDYQASFNMDKRSVTTDQAIKLTATIVGNGDIKRVQAHDIGISKEDFEHYPAKVTSDPTGEQNGQIMGKKIISYDFIPKRAGRLTLAPEFTYFNPDSSKYLTIKAQQFSLAVAQGKLKKTAAISSSTDVDLEWMPNSTEGSLSGKDAFFFGSIPFWFLYLLPIIALGGAFWYKSKIDAENAIDPALKKSMMAKSMAEGRLKKAKELKNGTQAKAFYEEISQCLWGFISDKLQIKPADFSKQYVLGKFKENNAAEKHIQQLEGLLKTCEMALFAGMSDPKSMEQVYQNAHQFIIEVEVDEAV